MERKIGFKIVSIIDLLLLLVSIYANVLGIMKDNNYLQYIANLLAIILAFAYYFVGYKKKGNLYYRLFSGFLALKEMLAIMYIGVYENVPAYTFIIFTICFGVYLILAVAKDLGKKLSFVLASINIALSAFAFAYVAMNVKYISVITYNSTRLILTLVLIIMVYVKYNDKEIRGTK